MKLVIDLSSNTVAGGTTDDRFQVSPTQCLIEAPKNFDMSLASEWEFDGATLNHNPEVALNRAKEARKTKIKAEAEAMIVATDWKLQRAKEREAAGWATLSGIDVVLAERESIRRSSSTAEAALDALTTVADVTSFTWSVNIDVRPPGRLTHKQFLERFTDTEITAILTARAASIPLEKWWVRFEKSQTVILEDPQTIAGVNALEISGLIATGRAKAILT